jgi:hypothetical protein
MTAKVVELAEAAEAEGVAVGAAATDDAAIVLSVIGPL